MELSPATMINVAAADRRHHRQVLRLEDFAEADIHAVEATRAPESSKAFDNELK